MPRAYEEEELKIAQFCSGAREHAFAWKFARSAGVDRVAVCGECRYTKTVLPPLKIRANPSIDELVQAIVSQGYDLVVVGSEAFLEKGLIDSCRRMNLAAFGPTMGAAQLETSKAICQGDHARCRCSDSIV